MTTLEETPEKKMRNEMADKGLSELQSFMTTSENEHLYQNWERLFDLVKKGRHNFLGKPPEEGAWASDPDAFYGPSETGFLPTLEEIQEIVKWGATLYGHIETTTGWVEIQVHQR